MSPMNTESKSRISRTTLGGIVSAIGSVLATLPNVYFQWAGQSLLALGLVIIGKNALDK